MSSPSGEVAANIRAEVARRGMTQQQVADLVGEKQYWVSRRLTGAVPITTGDLIRFARALDMPAAELLPRSERVA